MKPIIWILIIAVVIGGGISFLGGNSEELIPFAQCLTDNGAKFYGSFQCSHCLDQKNMFGKAMNNINYIECGPLSGPQNPVCQQAGVTGYPTWVIHEEKYVGTQSLEKLAEITGCQLPY